MTKHTVWDADMKETLKILAEQGCNAKEIAEVLEVIISSVRYVAKEMGITLPSSTKCTLSDEELLNRLRCAKDVTIKGFKGPPSSSVYVSRFGSWTKALELAGVFRKPRVYSDEELLNILRDSETPTYNHFIQSNDLPSAVTYRNRFGSWAKALELAGVEQNSNSLIPSKNTLVYLLEFDGFYKVGITQQALEERFMGYPKYEVLLTLNCTLDEARKIEKEWLANTQPYRFYGTGFPRCNGATECFKT